MILEGVRFFGVFDDFFCPLCFLGVDDADICCLYNFASMVCPFCSLTGTGGRSKLEEGGNTSGVLVIVPQVMIGF